MIGDILKGKNIFLSWVAFVDGGRRKINMKRIRKREGKMIKINMGCECEVMVRLVIYL